MNFLTGLHLDAFFRDGKVWLSYQLGAADGITLLSRREGETEYVALAEDEASPVIDSRPKLDSRRPETRSYRAIFRYSANEIRRFSNEVKLIVP